MKPLFAHMFSFTLTSSHIFFIVSGQQQKQQLRERKWATIVSKLKEFKKKNLKQVSIFLIFIHMLLFSSAQVNAMAFIYI